MAENVTEQYWRDRIVEARKDRIQCVDAWLNDLRAAHRWPPPARTWRSKRAWFRAWLRSRLGR